MQTSTGLDLTWWITAVELPTLAGLFWMNWRNQHAADCEIDTLRHGLDVGLAHLRQHLDAYKLDVAKNYVSIAHLKDVEKRLTSHLIRIEDKLNIRQIKFPGDEK
ncbi:MAG: hypothetical protein JKY17_00600 [Magnetovibrio sp.]|nr:hypothetical protein [Magnetovibrio sp.]